MKLLHNIAIVLKWGGFLSLMLGSVGLQASILSVNQQNPACHDIIGNPYCTVAAAIAASAAGDTILISAGTYTERGMALNKNLTLYGENARTTIIDGGNIAPRIFTISTSADVDIEHLTISHGRDESNGSYSVYNYPNLVSYHSEGGAAIYNQGTLSIDTSTLDSNTTVGHGGAILNTGNLTISQSTISNNTALHGGGIKHNAGILHINASTFSGNQTIESGAALSLDATTHINNSTIIYNTADSDASTSGHAGGIAIGDFTWGIYVGSFPTDVLDIFLKNTIVAANRDNSPNQNDPPHDCRGSITSEGYNLIQTTMSCVINGTFTYGSFDTSQTHDIYGLYPGYPLNIRLGSLANNGGETNTHLPLSGSPVIDAGDQDDCLYTDQRGFARPVDIDNNSTWLCDIGAVELSKCGDGVAQTKEECDDGNNLNTDACLNTCFFNTCGDGYLNNTTEECDTGIANSNQSGKTCRINCKKARCGDDILDPGEECDKGNLNGTSGSACHTDCKLPRCGDGVTDPNEECDNGSLNGTSGALCRATCKIAKCGDGIWDQGEECDAGTSNSNKAGAICRTNCKKAGCGDGVTDPNEECDNGSLNGTSGALCRATCKTIRCGDGIIDPGEVCDTGDSNGTENSNCSITCMGVNQKSTGTHDNPEAGNTGSTSNSDSSNTGNQAEGESSVVAPSCSLNF